jgi:predicted nucleotidyltransferase
MNVSNLTEIQELAKPLFKKFNLKQAAVFGSFARNEQTKKSDIDLVIDFFGKYDLLDLVGLKQDLEKIFNSKVDLVTLKSISDKDNIFGQTILNEAKVIYEEN